MKHIKEYMDPTGYPDQPGERISNLNKRKNPLFETVFGYYRDPGEDDYPQGANSLNIMRKLDDNSLWLLSIAGYGSGQEVLDALKEVEKKKNLSYVSTVEYSTDGAEEDVVTEWDLSNLATDMYEDRAYVATPEEFYQSEEDGGKEPYKDISFVKLDDPEFIEEVIQMMREWENLKAYRRKPGYFDRGKEKSPYHPWSSTREKARGHIHSNHWWSRNAIVALNKWLKEVESKKTS